MKKVAIYIRVSTTDQAEKGYSIEGQKERLISFAKAKDWNIYDIYVDGGFSGSNLDRPGMNKLLEDIKEFDVVLVYKLDRLSRSQKDTLYLIEEKFLPNNVDFVSVQETLDTTSPFGKAMIGILSVFAQLERETITERMKLGRRERAKLGMWHGGGSDPLGYDYDMENDKLVVNDYEAMQVREIYDMFLSGTSKNKINQYLVEKGYTIKGRKWSKAHVTVISRILENELYIGKIKFGGEVFEGKHQPIIDEDKFNKIQRIIKKEYSRYYKNKGKFLLTRLLYCGNCGARYNTHQVPTGKKDGPKYYQYYICYSRSKSNKKFIMDPNCKNKNWRVDKLDKLIYDKINQIKLDEKQIKKRANLKEIKIDYTDKIKDIDKQIERLMDLYQQGTIPTSIISERIEGLYKEKKSLENIEAPQEETNLVDVKYTLDNFDIVWDHGTMEEKKRIVSTLINKIIIHDNDIEIEWAF